MIKELNNPDVFAGFMRRGDRYAVGGVIGHLVDFAYNEHGPMSFVLRDTFGSDYLVLCCGCEPIKEQTS